MFYYIVNKCNLAIQLQTKEGIFRLTTNLAGGTRVRIKENTYTCPVLQQPGSYDHREMTLLMSRYC